MKPPESLFESHARHRLRAVGNEGRRSQPSTEQHTTERFERGDDSERPFGRRPKDSASRAEQLLTFLSKSAAQFEKNLLSPTPVPEFAKVKSNPMDQDLQTLLQGKRRKRALVKSFAPEPVEIPSCNDSLLGMLADTLAQEAAITCSSFSPSALHLSSDSLASALVGTPSSYDDASAPIAESAPSFAEVQSLSEVYSACMADLDKWLGFEALSSGEFEQLQECAHPKLPAALPAILPELNALPTTDDADFADVSITMRGKPEIAETAIARKRGSRYRRFLFNKNVLWRPRMTVLPNGSRRERYTNGAELTKDVHGRVLEIRTADGTSVQVHYDHEGKPDSFIRLDPRHQAHSLGERDKHGVVVRDPDGRVRAAGESMFVDPKGCVSVRRHDGQFWSLDLLKGVHIERRRVTDRTGEAFMLTALFASDGFRMVTRFQSIDSDEHTGVRGEETRGTFRFYGRDGSLIEFASEDDLLELKPLRVCQPGSRVVEPTWRGFYQAGTAWESVQEYITNYLLA